MKFNMGYKLMEENKRVVREAQLLKKSYIKNKDAILNIGGDRSFDNNLNRIAEQQDLMRLTSKS